MNLQSTYVSDGIQMSQNHSINNKKAKNPTIERVDKRIAGFEVKNEVFWLLLSLLIGEVC